MLSQDINHLIILMVDTFKLKNIVDMYRLLKDVTFIVFYTISDFKEYPISSISIRVYSVFKKIDLRFITLEYIIE